MMLDRRRGDSRCAEAGISLKRRILHTRDLLDRLCVQERMFWQLELHCIYMLWSRKDLWLRDTATGYGCKTDKLLNSIIIIIMH
jgi:hypothetical protein